MSYWHEPGPFESEPPSRAAEGSGEEPQPDQIDMMDANELRAELREVIRALASERERVKELESKCSSLLVKLDIRARDCERNRELIRRIASLEECLEIANRSADDQMFQKRAAEKPLDSARERIATLEADKKRLEASANVWEQQAQMYCDEAYQLRRDKIGTWIPTSERLPEVCKTVLGYADRWVDDEYNEMGMRECFRNDDEWQSPVWNNYQDCWDIEVGPPDYWMPLPSVPIDAAMKEGK